MSEYLLHVLPYILMCGLLLVWTAWVLKVLITEWKRQRTKGEQENE